MKFCKDCANYTAGIYIGKAIISPKCTPPSNEAEFDVVTGEQSLRSYNPREARNKESMCGTSAIWFVPRQRAD